MLLHRTVPCILSQTIPNILAARTHVAHADGNREKKGSKKPIRPQPAATFTAAPLSRRRGAIPQTDWLLARRRPKQGCGDSPVQRVCPSKPLFSRAVTGSSAHQLVHRGPLGPGFAAKTFQDSPPAASSHPKAQCQIAEARGRQDWDRLDRKGSDREVVVCAKCMQENIRDGDESFERKVRW